MWFFIAGILGIVCGLLVPYNLSSTNIPYIAVALIAALDSICGAFLANLNKKFNMNVLMTGLISNVVLAVIFTYVGNLLGIQLYFVVMIVFGVRIFNNVAAIRRITTDIYFQKQARRKEQIRRRELKAAEDAIDVEFEEENGTKVSATEKSDNTDKKEEKIREKSEEESEESDTTHEAVEEEKN